MDKKEYFLYVKGKAVPVSEEVYNAYWKITEHEKYLQRKDWKYSVIPFSSFDHDGPFIDNIVDGEKIVETQMMIEAVRNAISKLNDEERDIIERLYFNDETLSSIARGKKVSYQAIQWRKNSILKKLRVLLEEFMK